MRTVLRSWLAAISAAFLVFYTVMCACRVGLSRVTRCAKLRVASAQQLHVLAATALPVGMLMTCRFEAQSSEQVILQREKEET